MDTRDLAPRRKNRRYLSAGRCGDTGYPRLSGCTWLTSCRACDCQCYQHSSVCVPSSTCKVLVGPSRYIAVGWSCWVLIWCNDIRLGWAWILVETRGRWCRIGLLSATRMGLVRLPGQLSSLKIISIAILVQTSTFLPYFSPLNLREDRGTHFLSLNWESQSSQA
jgi:hypothetical protein